MDADTLLHQTVVRLRAHEGKYAEIARQNPDIGYSWLTKLAHGQITNPTIGGHRFVNSRYIELRCRRLRTMGQVGGDRGRELVLHRWQRGRRSTKGYRTAGADDDAGNHRDRRHDEGRHYPFANTLKVEATISATSTVSP